MYLYILDCSFVFFVITVIAYISLYRRLNYVRFAKKKKKIGTLPPFLRVLGIFLFNVRLGTGASYARAKLILTNSDVHPHTFHLTSGTKCSKMAAKYHPQKSLSNNAKSVVKSLPPLTERDSDIPELLLCFSDEFTGKDT